MNTIPKGYQLHVTSWENDGDNYKTEVLSGLMRENQIGAVVAVSFRSKWKDKVEGITDKVGGNKVEGISHPWGLAIAVFCNC